MCGFGVILRTGDGAIPESWLDALDAAVAVRGPDGAGRFRDRVVRDGPPVSVAMVHRRLAVIDPADGAQPMIDADPADPDGLVAVAFNGFIANHRELRTTLGGAGHRFRTDHCDTEVLIHGTRAWGDGLNDRLEGMVAAATWDRRAGRLRLIRDWFGEKPLWVARRRRGTERLLVAGSHAGAVAAVADAFAAERPGATEDWDDWPEHAWDGGSGPEAEAAEEDELAWLERYLALGYAHPLAPRGVRAVPPTLPPPVLAGEQTPEAGPPPTDPDALDAAVDAAIGQAVARRIEADVPLGCFLSGGVDSTLVTAHARRLLGRVPTFTVRMPDPRHDESAHAAEAARILDTDHHVLDPGTDAAGELDRLTAAAGLPLADSSVLPAAWVCRAARETVTCCLGGDGGDELFGGYDRYRGAALLAGLRPWLTMLPSGLGAGGWHHPRGRWRRLGRLGTMARDWPHDGVLAMERIAAGPTVAALTGRRPSPPPWPVLRPGRQTAAGVLRQLDLVQYLPGDLMAKMDTASMAVALEVRSPLLDRDLVRLATSIDLHHHLDGGTKTVLRRRARAVLGAAADRPKQGFAIPLDTWMRDGTGGLRDRLDDALASSEAFGGLPIDRGAASRLRDEHRRGHRDHGAMLFALTALATWAAARPHIAAPSGASGAA